MPASTLRASTRLAALASRSHDAKSPVAFACLLGLLLPVVSSEAAVYTVGPPGTSGSCTHTSIQSAISAAAVNPGADEIRIASNQTWSNQALSIVNQDLIITGGFADCFPLAPTGQSRLSGAGGVAASVFVISNTDGSHQVRLSRLEIVNGDAADTTGLASNGGGLRWQGPGRLELERVRIANNRASNGGGINIISSVVSPPLALAIGPQVQIEDNQALAGSGGGIYMAGADLLVAGADTTIRRNTASNGGGIAAFPGVRPLLIDISSGGQGSDGVIAANSGFVFGGGIYVWGDYELRLYTSDPMRPLRLERNAAGNGGAIFAENGPRIALWEAVVSDNVATIVGAAFALDSAALTAYRIPNADAFAPPGAVVCASQTCNALINNIARNNNNQPVNAAIAVIGGSHGPPTDLRIESAVIRGNQGSSLFSDRCDLGDAACDLSLRLRNSEVVGNPAETFSLFGNSTGAYLELCTLANFGNSPIPLIYMNNGILNLSRSIVWQPGRAITATPTVLVSSFLLLHDTSGFPSDPNIRSGDPRFVDAAAGNWRLAADSPALDSAPTNDAPAMDLDRTSRVVDLPSVPNLAGSLDLGAWERALTDRIFIHGFEAPL